MSRARDDVHSGSVAENLASALKDADKSAVGAAISKLVSASIGDIAVIMSRSREYRYKHLADIDWLVIPAVLSGQYYVAETHDSVTGLRMPVACITWASVSQEVALRLAEGRAARGRPEPGEWTSGDDLWLVDLIGEPSALASALGALKAGPFKGRIVSVATQDSSGNVIVETLQNEAVQTGTRT